MKDSLEFMTHVLNMREPSRWIDLRSVGGYDRSAEFERGKRSWRHGGTGDGEIEHPAEIMADYLTWVIRDPDCPAQPSNVLVDAALFLIETLGSTYATYTLPTARNQLVGGQSSQFLDRVLSTRHATSEPFVKDLLRDFMMEVLNAGPFFPDWETRLSGPCSPMAIAALERIISTGYLTKSPAHVPQGSKPTGSDQ